MDITCVKYYVSGRLSGKNYNNLSVAKLVKSGCFWEALLWEIEVVCHG